MSDTNTNPTPATQEAAEAVSEAILAQLGVGRRKAAGSHSFTEAHPIGAPARSSAA